MRQWHVFRLRERSPNDGWDASLRKTKKRWTLCGSAIPPTNTWDPYCTVSPSSNRNAVGSNAEQRQLVKIAFKYRYIIVDPRDSNARKIYDCITINVDVLHDSTHIFTKIERTSIGRQERFANTYDTINWQAFPLHWFPFTTFRHVPPRSTALYALDSSQNRGS